MNVQFHVFDGPPRDTSTPSLKMAAKRYTKGSSHQDVQGLTLLFTHCIGAHKEQFEPLISLLFDHQYAKDPAHRIREAWSFDWQNHGDSAVLNREALKSRPEGVSAFEWSAALASFVKSPRMKGHRIVPLGHSAGGAVVLLTTKHLPPAPYPALILIEPTLVTRELFHLKPYHKDRIAHMNFAVATTAARRDRWRSREAAAEYLKGRLPWERWDGRIVDLYVEHGLEPSPLSPSSEVSLKCDRLQESISFTDLEPHFEGAPYLGKVCDSLPIHLIWGTRNDYVPEIIQDSLADASQGRVVASVTKIQDAGHMVVQEQPDALALAIVDILDRIPVGAGAEGEESSSKSKL